MFGRGNNFTIGLSVDRGLVQFAESAELGTLNANQFPFVQGTGLFINQPSGDVAPVGLGATTLYTGLYATDTLDVTSRLSVTAGGRYNFAQINLTDALGNNALLDGNRPYPTFQSHGRRDLQAHAEPDVLRRFCSGKSSADAVGIRLRRSGAALLDRQRSCRGSQSSTSRFITFEGGLRGQFNVAQGLLNWTVGGFHALNTNDILPVSFPLIGHQFFQNASSQRVRALFLAHAQTLFGAQAVDVALDVERRVNALDRR